MIFYQLNQRCGLFYLHVPAQKGLVVIVAYFDSVKRAALYRLVDFVMEDPGARVPGIMDALDKIAPEALFPSQRAAFKSAIESQNNWYQLMMKILTMNPEVVGPMLKTFLVDANLIAWPKQERERQAHECNIPWAILLDPTSACNLHCTGCWAAEYGHSLNLTFDEIESVITQGKALGVHVYIYTGGEPLIRKADIIELCKRHPDCAFLCFTNATLIDEAFCEELARVKNFVPAISAEGDMAATDSRRGEGTYEKVCRAMALLRERGLPFGVSCCYTSENADSIASEPYFDWLVGQGALFAWVFTFMPVGADAPVRLMPTAQQRERLYRFIRRMRTEKPLFTLDFQHDGEYVGGCIAGGRRYLHINAAGDVEPCVFIHYSNANIREASLLDALNSPLFRQYYERQPFDGNFLRPCPMLENPDCIVEMVGLSEARCTDLTAKESAAALAEKCRGAAAEWEPVAQRLWADPDDPARMYRDRPHQGMADSDLMRLRAVGHPMAR